MLHVFLKKMDSFLKKRGMYGDEDATRCVPRRIPDDVIDFIMAFLVPCTVCTRSMIQSDASSCSNCKRSWCAQCKPTASFRHMAIRNSFERFCLYCYMVDLHGGLHFIL